MQDLLAIYRKELSDHFSSNRFVIIFGLIAMVSFITSYMAGINLRENIEGEKPTFIFLLLFSSPGAMLSMMQFVAFFGPLIGIVLGFDSINRERAHGTLIKIISQPIYRDAVINGKFLAGITTISIMLLSIILVITGFGLTILGIVPGSEEIIRIFIFFVISVFYISFWLALSILFSILFRNIATSALASIAAWIFLSFFISLGADVMADSLAPIDQKEGIRQETLIRHIRIKEIVSHFSPLVLYSDASSTIINPLRKTTRSLVFMGPVERLSASRFQNPLPVSQSLLVVYPHIVALIAISVICFAISYTVFMLQEIRV